MVCTDAMGRPNFFGRVTALACEMWSRTREGLSRPRRQLALLLALSVGLHAWHLACALRDPYLQHRVVDEAYYHSWGNAIASGALSGDLPFFTSPLFAYWLGLLYALGGDTLATVLVANAILGVATVALTWGAALRLVGPRPALWAGLLVAACRAPVFYAGLAEKSALVLFLTALTVFALAWADKHPGKGRFAVAGVAAGTAALAHPLILVMIPAVAVHALASMRGARNALSVVTSYAAGALVAVAPATLHNFAKSGEVILVCWNGGAALYAGNESWNKSGLYAPPPFSMATIQSETFDYWREAERRVGHHMKPAETSAFWTHQALREMWGDPALTGERYVRRLRWTVGDHEIEDSRTFAFHAERLPSLRILPWGFGLVALLGILGALAVVRERRLVFLLAFIGAYAATLAFFFVYGRYRLPLLIPLAILAGTMPARATTLFHEGRPRPLFAAATAAILVAALVFVPPFGPPESFFVDYNNLAVVYQEQGRIEEALAEFEKAVTVRPGTDPRVTEMSTELALLFWRRGEHERSKRLLRDVLRARPADEDVRTVLGTLERL